MQDFGKRKVRETVGDEKENDLEQLIKKLEESSALFHTVFEQAPVGIAVGHNEKWIFDPTSSLPGINSAFEKILCRSKKELADISWMDITHPDDLQADLVMFQKLKSGEIDSYSMEKRFIHPDGSDIWVRMTVVPLKLENDIFAQMAGLDGDEAPDETGIRSKDFKHICILEDITKRKIIEKELRESERSKSVLLSNLPGMSYRYSYGSGRTMEFVSEGSFRLTGYRPECLIKDRDIGYDDLILEQYRQARWDEWNKVLSRREPFRLEYEIATADGSRKWVYETGQGVYDDDGRVEALEGIVIDITGRKQRELEINRLKNHDYLTGLNNRRYFVELLSDEIMRDPVVKRAVLLIYLRHYNTVNLIYGYPYGESIVKELANELQRHVRDNILLFKISADRFCFYVRDYEESNELICLCDLIRESFNKSVYFKTIGGGIGIYEIERGVIDPEVILKCAAIAASNQNNTLEPEYTFFSKEMEARLLRKAMIKEEIAVSTYRMSHECLSLAFQPIVSLDGAIAGFEALSRYESENLGCISPEEFIPIAEETQLIIPLGEMIIDKACAFLKEIESLGYNDIKLYINISIIQLLRDSFPADIYRIVKEKGVNPSNLCLEITESVFSSNFKAVNERLQQFRELGFSIALDDFGAGYSSLSRERELNVNYLKLDKHFIDDLTSANKLTIVGDIISMAHKLGHYVIAEGVENEVQKDRLCGYSCDYMQGFLFSQPLVDTAALEFLKEWKKK